MAETKKIETVRMYIPIDPLNPKSDPYMTVICNCKPYSYKRGQYHNIPVDVAKIITDSAEAERLLDEEPTNPEI